MGLESPFVPRTFRASKAIALAASPMVFAAFALGCNAGAGQGIHGDGDASGDAGNSGYISPDGSVKGNLALWTSGVGRKVQPSTAPGPGTSIALETYRDAYVSAQVVVRASGGDLSGVRVATTDLSDGAGHSLSSDNLVLFRAAFIDFTGVTAHGGNLDVPKNSPTGDGRIPDALVPLVNPYTQADAGQPFDVQGEHNQPLWLDVHVPKGTVAGTYLGNLTITATGGSFATVPVSVKVWPIDLPDMRSVTTHFKMSTNDFLQYHKGISTCSASSCWLDYTDQAHTLVKRYEELAHSHRIDTEQSFVVSPDNACAVPTDWTEYDNAMAPYMTGAYWSDGVPSSRLGTPFSPGASWGLEAQCTQAQYTALAAAWAAHLKAKGWFDKAIVYAADEPDSTLFPAIAENSTWMQAGDLDWKAHIMDTTAPTASNVSVLNPALGIYCVALAWYDNWNDHGAIYGREEWPGLMSQGIQLWFYESNAQDPPYVTFASNTLDGLEPTLMMWGAWYEHATGFLYWDIAAWTQADPWGPTIGFNKTGDGVLLYPGNHDGVMAPVGSPADVTVDGPIPSQRLKMVRQGLQDWALFQLADQKGLGTQARASVAKVYSQLGGCTYSGCPAPAGGFFWKSDEALIAQVRAEIAALVMP
jgi:hypothetical protein